MKQEIDFAFSVDPSPNPRHDPRGVTDQFRIDQFDMGAATTTRQVAQAPLGIGASTGNRPDIDRRPKERFSTRNGNEGRETEVMAMEIKGMDDVCVDEIRV